ncbi:MAG TPA: trypsin-like peptidase domain-containing protein [Lacipirellulaceae bacterium]|nr:trypsin-like peptidase domain-containing protein [Lacipirellulaceae bacterium]
MNYSEPEAPSLPVHVPTELQPGRAASSGLRSANGERHGSGVFWTLLVALLVVLLGPIMLGRFIYHATYNELKAGYDVATGTLASLKPRLNDLALASRLVAKRVEPSVVSIVRPDVDGFEGQGSGVIVDRSGYIVTNSHVVRDAERIQVRLSDRRNAIATVIADDPIMDIAILKIDLPNLIPAEWGDSDQLQEGDLVWAIGSPFGLERSLTFGIVSNKTRRSGSHLSDSPYQEYLQTDAAVNPGNSGGPLVNIDGQVVGINAAIFGPAYQGISFAIPSALVRERYDELKTNGRIERAWLGILPLDVPDDVRAGMKLELGEGVYVATVDKNAPAGRVGLRPGDVILKWNDHTATDPTLLSREIARTPIGSTAKLTILRATGSGNERLDLDVEVERRRPER